VYARNVSDLVAQSIRDAQAQAQPKPTMMNRPPPGGWTASDTVPKPNESPQAKSIRDEIKKLRQGLSVAEDMAMNDKGASLDKLNAKITEAEERLRQAITSKPAEPISKSLQRVTGLNIRTIMVRRIRAS